MIIRIVDIGSNSVKASLYRVEKGKHQLIGRDKLEYSLGAAVFPHGDIPDSGLAKIAAFIRGSKSRRGAKANFTFALATSAVRSAKNRDTFVRRLSEKSGVAVRLLSGAEESFLIHGGILSRANPKPRGVIKTIDIGGGSAEVSWSRDGKYLFGRSYDLGAIRLARRFFSDKALTEATLAKVYDFALAEFRAFSSAEAPAAHRAIGSSGNIRAIAHMVGKVRAPAFRRRMPGITPGALEDISELCIGRTASEIASLFDLPLARARIIPAGVMVLLASLRHFGIRQLEIAEAGLREGAAVFWGRHGHLTLPVLEEHGPETENHPRKPRA
jgi:exopolyphosphatase/guanosine-5'-triphosphate,3'-diphosphate pyrophosphatase